jgi:hypothetical protein
MNLERLQWIMSGLNRYKLTEKEDQFVKSTEYDFNQKSILTEQQEEKLEFLYKEKSRLTPNRNYLSPGKVFLKKRPKRKSIVQNLYLDDVQFLSEVVFSLKI